MESSQAGAMSHSSAEPIDDDIYQDTLVSIEGCVLVAARLGQPAPAVVQRYNIPLLVEYWRAGRPRLCVSQILHPVISYIGDQIEQERNLLMLASGSYSA